MSDTPPAATDVSAREQAKWDAFYAGQADVEETPAVRAFGTEFAGVLRELLPDGRAVLEAGSGAGFQSLALAREGRLAVSLMDISPQALAAARRLFARNGLTADARPGDAFATGTPEFDLVFNAGVLEHYTDDQQAAFLRGMASRSRRFVLVLVPNRRCYWYWVWRVQEAARRHWPYGKECPQADLSAAFRAAGLTYLGQAFVGAEWTEDLIANVHGLGDELREEVLAVHRAGVVDAAERCYLTAALGCIGDPPAELPARWQTDSRSGDMRLAELTAALADTLALRLGMTTTLRSAEERLRTTEQALAEAQSEVAAFRSFRASGTYKLAERLRKVRVAVAPPHSLRAKVGGKLLGLARATARPVRWLAGKFARPPAGFDAMLKRVRASGKRAVVFLPSLAWSETLFQRPHHLAREFARLGHAVVYDATGTADPPTTVTEVLPNLFLYAGDPAHLRALGDPIVWAFTYNFGQAAALGRRATVVYDWIDDLSVFPHDQAELHRLHARALKEAAVVTSVARRLHAQATAVRPDALYLPNAAEYERFADPNTPPANDPQLGPSDGRPTAGYYGALARWFDYRLLDEVAALRPDWRFVLIGPDLDDSTRDQPALRRKNVLWLGPRQYHTLPGYLRHFDVATIPFVINEITLATSPLKLFEYFAAGKPVVTTPLPECVEHSPVRAASTAAEFAAALDAAYAERNDPDFRRRVQAIGEANSWAARARAVAARFDPARPEAA